MPTTRVEIWWADEDGTTAKHDIEHEGNRLDISVPGAAENTLPYVRLGDPKGEAVYIFPPATMGFKTELLGDTGE